MLTGGLLKKRSLSNLSVNYKEEIKLSNNSTPRGTNLLVVSA